MQFASRDDPFLPWDEQMKVAEGSGAELHQYDDEGHFQDEQFGDLLKLVTAKVVAALGK